MKLAGNWLDLVCQPKWQRLKRMVWRPFAAWNLGADTEAERQDPGRIGIHLASEAQLVPCGCRAEGRFGAVENIAGFQRDRRQPFGRIVGTLQLLVQHVGAKGRNALTS